MAFIFSRKRNKISPSWNYDVAGILWRIMISPKGFIIGEDRDKEKKTVSFFCIEIPDGRVLWKDVRFDEPWWIGLEAVHENVILFHEYAVPDMPGHKKIYALDLMTGKLLWSNDNVQFLFAYDNMIYTAREHFEERELFEVDISTGEARRKVDGTHLAELQKMIPLANSFAELPMVLQESEIDSPLQEILHAITSGARKIVHQEFLKKNDLVLCAYYDEIEHAGSEPQYDEHFVVAEGKNGKILFQDILNTSINMAVPDAFFCVGDFGYYIKNKKTLSALHIVYEQSR
jgi:hypothetical protein